MAEKFPRGTEEVWDVTAKALLLRNGGVLTIPADELEDAARVECEIILQEDGSLLFRIADQQRQ